MNETQSLEAMKLLAAGFPGHSISEATVELYASEIRDLDYSDTVSGLRGLVKRWGKDPAGPPASRLPTLGEIRKASQEGAMQVVGFTADEIETMTDDRVERMRARRASTGRWLDDLTDLDDV